MSGCATLKSRCGFAQVLFPALFLEVAPLQLFQGITHMVPAESDRYFCELVSFHHSANNELPVMWRTRNGDRNTKKRKRGRMSGVVKKEDVGL